MWALASFIGRTSIFSSGPSFLSNKEVFWFIMDINLSIQVNLEDIPRRLRLWWPGVSGTLERSVQQSIQNLLAEMLGPAPSIIHEMILPLGWLSGGCGSTGFSHCLNHITLVRTKARGSFTQETSPGAVPAKPPSHHSGLPVLAIELLAACQGIEFLRPLRTTTPLEKVYDLVRSVVR